MKIQKKFYEPPFLISFHFQTRLFRKNRPVFPNAMNKNDNIQAKNLTIGYGKGKKTKIVRENLSFSLEQGKLTALLGANGAGKSTLIKTLCGFIPPIKGHILLEGKPLASYSTAALSQKIGTVLTDRNLDGGLTVSEIIGLGRYPYTDFFGRLTARDREIAVQAAAQAGIGHKTEIPVALLSDGERQKTMIAKALAQQCQTVILDEPTAFLDVKSRIEITNLLRNIAREGKTVMMSTHDLELALQLSDNLWILSDTYGLEEGCTEDLILKGALNHIFEDRNIVFEPSSGTFRYNRFSEQKIMIEKGNGELNYWIKNALLRNGYACTETEADRPCARIFPVTPQEILLKIQDREIRTTSVRQLLNALTDFFHP